MSEIKTLERVITALDTLYEEGKDCIHPDTNVIVTDSEYDALRRRLAELEPQSKIFSTPTASTVDSAAKKVVHSPPMTSISKASHENPDIQEGMLFKFLTDCVNAAPDEVRKRKVFDLAEKTIDGIQHKERIYNGSVFCYPRNYFVQTFKMDGGALSIDYVDGKIKSAGLRPRDGINGEDVTEQVKYIKDIPQQLPQPLTLTIRGETYCKLSDFEEVQKYLAANGEPLRANPRNHAAAGIRQFKDPSEVANMRLSFMGHSIENFNNPPYKTEIERAKWCNKELKIPFVQAQPFSFYDLAKMEALRDKLDYWVDGIVISVDSLEDQEQMGRHGNSPTGNPRGKIAWKFPEEVANPELFSITWATGRTGDIKPVANFTIPVSLGGTSVKRATLHNLGFIYRNKIGIGTVLAVVKAGNIIPKVTGVVDKEIPYRNVDSVPYPRLCLSCGCDTIVKTNKDMHELICPNKEECPSQNVASLEHYLKIFGVLGLGESKIAALVEGEAVKSPADFYHLDVDAAVKCGLSPRQALLAIAGIHMIPSPEKKKDDDLVKAIEKAKKTKKSVPLWKLFASFGIESAGKSAGKALVDHFRSFDAIRAATVDELSAVPDVGLKTAQIIYTYLQRHLHSIDALLEYVEPELPKTGSLTGKTFVLTGGFAEGKKHWEAQIEERGGKCSSSVSKTTDYVVEGTDAGSKAEKAKTLQIPLISVDELQRILN